MFKTREPNALWAIDPRTLESRRLVRLPPGATSPLLSPNGKLVAFVEWVDVSSVVEGVKARFLFVMGVNGKRKVRLMRVGAGFSDDSFGDWSPDSTHLAVLPDPTDRPEHALMVVGAAGGAPRPLVGKPQLDQDGQLCSANNRGGCRWERPTWSPDGQAILTQVQQYGELNPDYGKRINASRFRSAIEWDRFTTIPVSGSGFTVVGPGTGACSTTAPDPETGQKKTRPCEVRDPSWQPRR